MQRQSSFIDEGIDRVQSAFHSVEKEFKGFQKRAKKNRKSFEKQFRSNPIVKRADEFQADLSKQIEANIEGLLTRLNLASHGDLKKIDRKLSQLSKKLKNLEEAQQ